jgi:hypothetical protein
MNFQLMVVSNSAVQINGTTNWAAVESSSTNDFVIIQAMIITTNNALVTNIAANIQWTGGVATTNPLQRLVSKIVATNTVVTASLWGMPCASIEVWVVWADLTINVTGTLDPDDNANILVGGDWPTPTAHNVSLSGGSGLGGGNGLGPVNSLTDANLNYEYAIGRMEAKAVLQPSGIMKLLNGTNAWKMPREAVAIFWNNGTNGPADITGFAIPATLQDDTSFPAGQYFDPTNGFIFDLDAPGCPDTGGTNINHTAECYANFYESVTVNFGNGPHLCSDTETFSYEAKIDGDASLVVTNMLSTSLINIPTNSAFTKR